MNRSRCTFGVNALQMMEAFYFIRQVSAEFERTEWPATSERRKRDGLPQTIYRDSLLGHLMLHRMETFFVVNDKEKRKPGFPQVRDAELKNVNQRLKPRKGKTNDVERG